MQVENTELLMIKKKKVKYILDRNVLTYIMRIQMVVVLCISVSWSGRKKGMVSKEKREEDCVRFKEREDEKTGKTGN